jgi:O-antigen/teichoic acid export membrane protein
MSDGGGGSLGRRAGQGMAWMVGTTMFVRLGSLVTQVALGWFLTDDDFGVYALALSIALVFQVLRDGGLRLLLVQEGPERFERHAVPAFWLSTTMAAAGAAILLVVSGPLAGRFDQPALTPVLVVLALSLPVQSMAMPGLAKLELDLRFAAAGRVELAAAVVRYGGTVILAALGAGALSFAVPVLAVAVTELVMGWWLTRVRAWRLPMQRHLWRPLFGRSRWAMANSLATVVPRQADYVALGLAAPTAVVGVYFFAYQLTFQATTLVQNNARRVLLAAFATRHTDEAWLRDALVRVAAAAAVAASGLFVLATVAADLEAVIWRGRWAVAVPAIEILALFLPVALVLMIADYALQATGRFRLSFVTSLVGNVGIPVVAYAAGRFAQRPEEAWRVAAAVGTYTVVSAGLQSAVALRTIGVPLSTFTRRTAPPLAIGAALALAVRAVPWPGPAVVGLVAGAVAYLGLFALAARLVLRPTLVDVVDGVGGGRAARLARRLLALGPG